MKSDTSTQTTQAKGNILERAIRTVNHLQQQHPILGFTYGVIKKYGDDNGSYQAALLTYYGFLSLFPLLIVVTSLANIVAQHNTALRAKLLAGFNTYFPVVGAQLQSSIHSSTHTGIALIIGLLIAFYGAKGVADAVQYALNRVWQVPKAEQPGFPKAPIVSLLLLAGGGIGMLAAAVLSSVATALGHSVGLAILSTLISVIMLFGVFSFLMTVGTASKHTLKDTILGALLAAVGIQVLETLGGYLITHQLHNLQGAYGQFALVLAILFWLYIQAEVFLYAAEANAVHARRLWPRSLVATALTEADKRTLRLYAERERFYDISTEEINVSLK